MDTSTRFSLRLQEKQRKPPPSGAAKPPATQTKKRPSSVSLGNPSSPKRRKVIQGAGEFPSQVPVTSRPDGRVKGRRGHLQFITEMPIDVLYEVLSFLEPVDLLHLSWTSKNLHSIIMGKSTRYIWEAVFKDLYAHPQSPPQCPFDINLAQYAKLLFDRRCMDCNSPHGSHVIWAHRLKVCGKCLEGSRFMVLTSLHRYWMIIPISRKFVHGRYKTFVLASEFNELKAKMDSLSSDGDKLRSFVREREKWLNARRQDEWKFTQWQKEQKRDRKNELEDMRTKRRDVIVHKLTQLGVCQNKNGNHERSLLCWGAELERLNPHQLWTFPGMRAAKPLTDKAWETLRPALIDHLEAVRALRLEQEKEDRISRRCDELSRKAAVWSMGKSQFDTLPLVLDFALSEPFMSMLLTDTDGEQAFTEPGLFDAFDDFLADWNETRNQLLSALIPSSARESKSNVKGKGKAETDTAALNLATTFFQCPDCIEPISYPRILAHKCLRPLCTQANERDTDPDHLTTISSGIYNRPWLCNAQDITFDRETSNIARGIVEECGEHPDEVTAERMDELDYRLECLRCSEPKKGRLVMKWRMAILHDLEKHSADINSKDSPLSSRRGKKATSLTDEARWKVVTSADDLALIHAREEKTPARKTVVCKRCPGIPVLYNLSSMQDHWNYFHAQASLQALETSTQAEPPTVLEETELIMMFEQRLDQTIKSTHSALKIPIWGEVDEDVNMK